MRMSVLESALEGGEFEVARAYCTDINGELRFAHGRLRELITQFRAGIGTRGLLVSLREAAANFVERSEITLDFECPAQELPLNQEQERQAFNIVQEALANVRKHAQAKRARLRIEPCNDAIEFIIEDDGRGFNAGRAGDDGEHYGLAIMHERAARAGGCLRIDSPVAGGTRVRLLLPVARSTET